MTTDEKALADCIEYAYRKLNSRFYSGKLPNPRCQFVDVIAGDEETIAGVFFNDFIAWIDGNCRHALTLQFSKLFKATMRTDDGYFLSKVLLHEMAHIANNIMRFYELSSTGYENEHGKDFKRICETHGLVPVWCGDDLCWAETELENKEDPAYLDIAEHFKRIQPKQTAQECEKKCEDFC